MLALLLAELLQEQRRRPVQGAAHCVHRRRTSRCASTPVSVVASR